MQNALLASAMIAVLCSSDARAEQRTRAVRGRRGATGCTQVRGLANFFLSSDAGQTFATNLEPGTESSAGIAILEDSPNIVVAATQTRVFDSSDGGCNWTLRFTITKSLHHLLHATPGTRGLAYVWNDDIALRYDNGTVTVLTTPQPFNGFGVDPSNPLHVRGIGINASLYESFDAGDTWTGKGVAAGTTALNAAFDPSDFNHILVGTANGLAVTHNGAQSWSLSPAFSRTICDATFVRYSPNVIWVNQSVRAGSDSLYRSTDGGTTFQPVGSVPDVENGVCLPVVSTPFDRDRAVIAFFKMYMFDATTKSVTATSCCDERILRVAFSPVDPKIMYVTGVK